MRRRQPPEEVAPTRELKRRIFTRARPAANAIARRKKYTANGAMLLLGPFSLV
jgi:hypothetical protein